MAEAITQRKMLTPEGEALQGTPWQAYPRPQLRRTDWINLNGEWDFAFVKPGQPVDYQNTILVPFPPESALSGVEQTPEPDEQLFYRKRVALEKPKGRLLLHFGAVDQIAQVSVNGKAFPAHSGGYEPFSLDITDCFRPETEILVRVTDPLDRCLPYGKQRRKRGGMWYTPVSGIWQTVWLEYVPEEYIRSVRFTPGKGSVRVEVDSEALEKQITIFAPEGEIQRTWRGNEIEIEIPFPRMWSPEEPFLYRATVRAGEDFAETYFALRTVEIGPVNGKMRLLLNGKPYFFHGLLDQGYFSDGIFLPASPEGYERDIRTAKDLGFNVLRKHIKREPEQFYYDCDRLGMIVFQDFVNNGAYSFFRDTALPTIGIKRMPALFRGRKRRTKENFLASAKKMVSGLFSHPCICLWTIFNEGWGQFSASEICRMVRKWDSTRLIDTASGWFGGCESDVESIHVYFRPVKLKAGSKKPVVLSEFGGYSMMLPEHSFCPDKVYGYRKYKRMEDYEKGVIALYTDEIIPAVKSGLCADIMTQLSDVEEETNGVITYDRRVVKLNAEPMLKIAQVLRQAVTDE